MTIIICESRKQTDSGNRTIFNRRPVHICVYGILAYKTAMLYQNHQQQSFGVHPSAEGIPFPSENKAPNLT